MKWLKYVFMTVLSFVVFIGNTNAASTKFDPTINMDPEIIDNQISIILGYKGEHAMALTQTLSYDDEYLSLVDIVGLEDFTITKSNEIYDDGYKTIKILADSDHSYSDINYAMAIFELKDGFKDSKKSNIFLYNYEAANKDKEKVRNVGYEMSLTKDSTIGMLYLLNKIDAGTKIRYWFYDHLVLIILIILIVIGVILVIFSIPSKRKKEHRENNLSNQIKQESYNNQNIAPIKINDSFLLAEEVTNDNVVNPFSDSSSESRYDYTKSSSESANEILNSSNIEVFNQNANEQFKTIEDIPNSKEPVLSSNTNKDLLQDKGIVELKDESEDLVLFQPVFDDEKKDDDKSIETLIFFFACLLSISLLIPNVLANNSEVDRLRNAIVGNIGYDKNLDYSNDGKIDVVDIIYTKNLENVIIDSPSLKPTTIPVVIGTRTTRQTGNISSTKEVTTNKITDKVDVTTKVSSTTKKITTTKKGTTTNNVTTTKKSSTTKKVTTKTETTTKGTSSNKKYTVNITYNNASANTNSVVVSSGGTAKFNIYANTGYKYSSVECSNNQKATYDKSDYLIKVSNVTNNTTCKITFVERDDMTVQIAVTNGSSSKSKIIGVYKKSGTATIKPYTGYEFGSLTCTRSLKATYDASKYLLTIPSLTNDAACSITFVPKIYSKVYFEFDSTTEKGTSISYSAGFVFGKPYRLHIETFGSYNKLICNGVNISFDKDFDENKYKYDFELTIKDNPSCKFYK